MCNVKQLMAVGGALLLTTGTVQAAGINFEALNHGAIFDNGQFDIDGFTGEITTQSNGSFNQAQIYSTDFVGGSDPDLEAPTNIVNNAVYGGGNAMIISETGDVNDPDDDLNGGSITFYFDDLVRFTGITLIDAEPNGNEIDVLVDGGIFALQNIALGDGKWQSFSGFSFDTKEITVNFGGSGAFDALQIEKIPAPASALLLLTGIASLQAFRRRRSL